VFDMPGDPIDSVCVRAPAKINLVLSVSALQPDGFHQVHTVFHAVSLYDVLTVTAKGEGITLEVTGEAARDVPGDASNLAVRAAELMVRRVGAGRSGRPAGLHLQLHKAIPVAGGMAGGSADAAAALVACDALWRVGLPREELADLAAELGSDVAFALVGGTAIGSGRGERITAALTRGTYHWVLVPSPDGLATPEVYAEFDRRTSAGPNPDPAAADGVLQALLSDDAPALGRSLSNDLQEAACAIRPDLADLLSLGAACGALGGLVSGSGPTVAFLVRDNEHALDLSVGLAASGACALVKRVSGPVPGARLFQAPQVVQPSRGR
jgi:4-diphosphocytidyl-2-C-methyl-D-erythritol kinase